MGHNHSHDHDHISHDRRVLWIVLALNASMFCLELWQGLQADSASLLADSMDFFGDSLSYIITLYVLEKSLRTRAKASLSKAVIMLVMAAVALTQGLNNLNTGAIPDSHTMGWVGMLALVTNTICAALLFGSRTRDSNMRSVWLCSRNDMINNLGVVIAAALVYATGTLWPDLALAAFICWIETRSAWQIIKSARKELA